MTSMRNSFTKGFSLFHLDVLTCILFLSQIPSFAQDISGLVWDAENKDAVAGVIVVARGFGGNVLDYCLSEKNGAFQIKKREGIASLEFTLLGYEKLVISPPFPEQSQVFLRPSQERIASAVITQSSVTVQGDTISYSAAAVRGRNDRSLGDLLKRLPGIEVTSAGQIRYNGAPVNRVYIEDRDILNGNYGFATENIDAQMLRSVQVYRNHQPVKALRGIVESETAALNIQLEDFAKGRWTRKLDAEGGLTGLSYPAWIGDLLGVLIGRQIASMNKINTNNIGSLPSFGRSEANVIRIGEEQVNRYALRDHYNMIPNTAPLEDIHANLNQSVNVQTINHYAKTEETNFGLSLKYARDRLSSHWTDSRHFLYPDQDGEWIFRDTEDNDFSSHFFSATGDILANKPGKYVHDVVYADISLGHGHSSITKPDNLFQDNSNKRLNVDNIFGATFRIADTHLLTVESYTQYTHDETDLFISPLNRRQMVSSDVFYTTLVVSGITRAVRHWNFTLTPKIGFLWRHQISNLMGPTVLSGIGPTSQNLFATCMHPLLQMEVFRQQGAWKVGGTLEIASPYYHFQTTESWGNTLMMLDGSAYLKYARGRVEAVFDYAHQNIRPDEQTVGDVLFLRDFQTLWQGRRIMRKVPSDRLGMRIGFREPLTGVYLLLTSSYSIGHAYLESRYVNEHFVLYQESDDLSDIRTLQGRISLSRGLASLRGKIESGLGYVRTASVIMQNGVYTDYYSSTLHADLQLRMNPVRWLGLDYSGNYKKTVYSIGGDGAENRHDLRQKGTVSLLPSPTWEIGLSAEHLWNRVSDNRQIVLVDASLSWQITGSLRLCAQAINLLNTQEFSVVTTTPLMVTSSSWQLRPRTLLLGVEWKF